MLPLLFLAVICYNIKKEKERGHVYAPFASGPGLDGQPGRGFFPDQRGRKKGKARQDPYGSGAYQP